MVGGNDGRVETKPHCACLEGGRRGRGEQSRNAKRIFIETSHDNVP
jgi:hypothetical protein